METVAAMLRSRPLLPPDPKDATKSWCDVDSGVRFPAYHCAFSGCAWTCDDAAGGEVALGNHVREKHAGAMGLHLALRVPDELHGFSGSSLVGGRRTGRAGGERSPHALPDGLVCDPGRLDQPRGPIGLG